jgi:shikimate kinase/3-dehydroquinate synthase
MSNNIFLIGLMGAGKTTIGRALAKKLNRPFFDSDHEIEARTGASVSTIFEIEGETSFRKREAETIRELGSQEGIVLATGGGAVLHPDTRSFLRETPSVIYLHASISQLLQRTERDKNRPLLQTADPRKKLEELFLQRDPFYREVADLVIETGNANLPALVQLIISKLALCTAEQQSVTHQP